MFEINEELGKFRISYGNMLMSYARPIWKTVTNVNIIA